MPANRVIARQLGTLATSRSGLLWTDNVAELSQRLLARSTRVDLQRRCSAAAAQGRRNQAQRRILVPEEVSSTRSQVRQSPTQHVSVGEVTRGTGLVSTLAELEHSLRNLAGSLRLESDAPKHSSTARSARWLFAHPARKQRSRALSRRRHSSRARVSRSSCILSTKAPFTSGSLRWMSSGPARPPGRSGHQPAERRHGVTQRRGCHFDRRTIVRLQHQQAVRARITLLEGMTA